ncbi:hypothetical protein [Micromonospora aurantiaca]|uniref:hypothetical protein n=1 Tax=Micromonospora aurantiaca (nom. illeg.) TaxID=47850 RepID=UPI003451585F
MILIQRVRVRWTAAARGSLAANAGRGLVRAMPPPRPLPDAELVVHDVLADQEVGYQHREGVRAGGVGWPARSDCGSGTTGRRSPFGYGEPDRDVDHRVRLYGGVRARR